MNSLDDEIRICPMCGNKTLWNECNDVICCKNEVDLNEQC